MISFFYYKHLDKSINIFYSTNSILLMAQNFSEQKKDEMMIVKTNKQKQNCLTKKNFKNINN